MIISFNPKIFQTQDDEIQSILADIVVELLKDKHFIETKSIESIFFDNDNKYIFNQNKIAQSYLSPSKREKLKEYIYRKIRESITKLYRDNLTHLTIGTDLGEIQPKDAYKIITERSKIIVENGINDWKFIWGICQKYSNGKIKRKSIYQLLNKAISQEMIEPDHAGGIGDVIKITERWINADRYHNIYQYKLMAIFDSDKAITNGFKTPHIDKIGYFKRKEIKNIQPSDYEYDPNDLIVWHILYKRKIENYVPLDTVVEKAPLITQTQKNDLLSKSESDLDFIDYNKDNIGQINIKEEFPKMFFGNFSYHQLEKRCEHHKVRIELSDGTIEEISELEQILLKIAKII